MQKVAMIKQAQTLKKMEEKVPPPAPHHPPPPTTHNPLPDTPSPRTLLPLTSTCNPPPNHH